ncbi:MAG: hypothetical protein KJ950_02385 [Proteobacteria bacterium]|nr:hypothetical protein [Pseudomonadota bacterium]MBU1686695.1 hypothetical protein [Pseudomonadota bacterium]
MKALKTGLPALMVAGLVVVMWGLAWPFSVNASDPIRFDDLQVFFKIGTGYLVYPDTGSYHKRDQIAWAEDFRVLVRAGNESFRFSINLLESSYSLAPVTSTAGKNLWDVERSSLFAGSVDEGGDSRSVLLIDSFTCQLSSGRFDFTAGRQPINLATTFYYSPNDLFAPFQPQTFFRMYKPGVDGVRLNLRLNPLSQVDLIGVLAYEADPASSTGWSQTPDWSQTSMLGRYSFETGGFQMTFLGGKVHDRYLLGWGFQGEIAGHYGLRSEGNYIDSGMDGYPAQLNVVFGLDRQVTSRLNWRTEYLMSKVFSNNDPVESGYSGRHHGGIGLGYEITPLLNATLLTLINLSDHSGLVAANLLYSLADEVDLTATIFLPLNTSSSIGENGSQFTDTPRSILLEYRVFF